MVAYHALTRAKRSVAQTKRILMLFIFFLFGCSAVSPSPEFVPASETPFLPVTFTPAPDAVTRLRNSQYQLGAIDVLRIVQLADGKFEEGTPGGVDYVSVTVTDFVALGDLNNDGVNEIAALIAENHGGTGVFTLLTVFADVNGSLAFITSVYVDDRPGLNALSIENGEIFLDATTHKNEDPMCCPTFRVTRHYRLGINNQLDVTDYSTYTPDGRPRTITIESPVHETEVSGSVQIRGSVSIAPFENNLVYRIYDIGGVELASGFITANAAELGGPGTFDAIISLGSTLSGAVIRIEIQDVSAEDGSLFAMDSVELVVK